VVSSPWFGLDIGLSALRAAQTMMDVAAHNTANANTDGYSRQRAQLVAAPPYTYPAFNRAGFGQLGTGVSVAAIIRVRDAFLDLQLRGQVSLAGYWDVRRDQLSQVESILAEPTDSGIGSNLNRFWGAWEDVAADPTSTAARAALVETAATLAGAFNQTARQLTGLVASLDGAVGNQVSQVNDLASRIAALNAQIQRVVVSGDRANDLEDQRDALLEQLSAIVPLSAQREADGTVTVLVGGVDLVNHDRARTMATTTDAAGHLVPSWPWGDPVALGQGQLGALVELRDQVVPGYLARLNALARDLATAVNALHQSGYDAAGNPGLAFWVFTPGSEAATLAVNPALVADPAKVAAASAPNQPGNGATAAAIADLRAATIASGGTQTVSDAYAGLVGLVGADARQATEMAANQELVVDHLRTRRESISGVSLDEEAADMIRFQHAYQAAARVITTVDELLDTLINRTGLVGR
jgi:flagellar hook-associated protein 1 FlgK